MEKPEIVMREDKILEVQCKEDFYQINLNNAYVILISKEKDFINLSINGVQNIEFPIEYYEGIIVALNESKLFENRFQDYYTLITEASPEKEVSERLKAKKKINDVFVNIKSDSVLDCITSLDDQKNNNLFISIVNKGTLVFSKKEDVEIPSNLGLEEQNG